MGSLESRRVQLELKRTKEGDLDNVRGMRSDCGDLVKHGEGHGSLF